MGGRKPGGKKPGGQARKPVPGHQHPDSGKPREEDFFEEPEGIASLPEIPREFGIDPLLLAVMESVVFLSGSDESVVHPDAAESVLSRIIGTLTRLDDTRRNRVLEDLATLKGHVSGPQWPDGMAEFLEQFAREINPGDAE
ncbi:MAG: hypothetical protein ACKO26_22885 [Planctomycetota bacterium]|jgi:hypothetical protein